jgi:hypothetical protein
MRPEDSPEAPGERHAMVDHDQRFKSLLKAFFAEFFQAEIRCQFIFRIGKMN